MGATAGNVPVANAAWLAAACARSGETARAPRLERVSADGRRRATVVEVEFDAGARVASHVLLAGAPVAVFEGRVERMEWSGEELLLAFAAGIGARVFSLFPGLRIREAEDRDGLAWLRLSTRHSRR